MCVRVDEYMYVCVCVCEHTTGLVPELLVQAQSRAELDLVRIQLGSAVVVEVVRGVLVVLIAMTTARILLEVAT